MNVKKFISAIAVLCTCAVMFTACGGGEEASSGMQNETSSAASSDEAAVSGSAENPDGTDEIKETSGEDRNDDSEGDEKSEQNETSAKGEDDSGADDGTGEADVPAADNGGDGEEANDGVPGEEIVFDDGEDYSEEENTAASNPVFASAKEFAESDISLLPFESTAYGSSHTYDFIKAFDGDKPLHLEAADSAAESFLMLYLDSKNNRLSMTMVRGDTGMVLPVIVTGSKMYILDPANMIAVYTNADKSVFTDILSLAGVNKEAVSGSKNINRCKVTIGGREYVFENSQGGGFLFKTDGSPYAVVSGADSLDLTVWEINEFSENIPDGVFDIPEDYQLVENTEANN